MAGHLRKDGCTGAALCSKDTEASAVAAAALVARLQVGRWARGTWSSGTTTCTSGRWPDADRPASSFHRMTRCRPSRTVAHGADPPLARFSR
jgi:hypothetical protein